VFPEEWYSQTPATSRLVHGAGILSLGAVMEIIAEWSAARSEDDFYQGLQPLKGRTAWTSGNWDFDGEVRRWNSLQNVNRDVTLLTHHLTSVIKADLRKKKRAAPVPLLEQAAE
jgi:hypothetical protein